VDYSEARGLLDKLREDLEDAERLQGHTWNRIKLLRGSINNLEGLVKLYATGGTEPALPLPVLAEGGSEEPQAAEALVEPSAEQEVEMGESRTAIVEGPGTGKSANWGTTLLTALAEGVVRHRDLKEPGPPMLREAIITVLNESRRTWTVQDLTKELGDRGWLSELKSPVESVRNSANRIAAQGVITRIPPSSYKRLPTLEEVQATQWSTGMEGGER
jgi:hypothetical protein